MRDALASDQIMPFHSLLTGWTPYHFEFQEEERIKTMCFSICRYKGKRQHILWSEIQRVVIL
ncbi:MAG: hypothetical protein LBL45_11155 [Treponema sp.]|nr:hypothetical protein [Treponema sp.]